MKNSDLVKKLETVSPALSGHAVIPALAHFWFHKGQLTAYNDQIGISVPCQFDVEGAYPGRLLLPVLKATNPGAAIKAKQLKNEMVQLSAGKTTRMKLSILPTESFTSLFKMPDPDKEEAAHLKFALVEDAIQDCMMSVGTDSSLPDQLGITLIFDKDEIRFYSTDRKTMSRCVVPLKKELKGLTGSRVVLSSSFCKQALALATDDAVLRLTNDWSMLTWDGGKLFGLLIEVESPLEFDSIISHALNKKTIPQFVRMPTKMRGILERAAIIAEHETDTSFTQIEVAEDEAGDIRAYFHTKSGHGEISDSCQIQEQHADIVLRSDPRLVLQGYNEFEEGELLFTEDMVIMRQDDRLYLVGSPDEK